MTTEEQFNSTVEFVRTWQAGKGAPPDVLAKTYGFYKQATVGDATGDPPADGDKKLKFDAWFANKGMSKEDARAAYVGLIEEKKKEYGGA